MKGPSFLLARFIHSLNEALDESSDGPRRSKLSKDSVDDQIDSILLKYESDCIITNTVDLNAIGESYLFEADEDEDKKKPELGDPEEEKDAEVAAQIGDKDKEIPDQEADPLQPKIDLKMFAGKVSRLATNYDALLDMPIAIVNRAFNYLKINYSQALAEEFSEVMERDFGIELKHKSQDITKEKPMAVGAAASGLGG